MELQENKELKTNNRDFSHSLLSSGLIRENDKYLNCFTCATLVQLFTTFLE